MKFNWNNSAFAIVAALFIVGIIYAITCPQVCYRPPVCGLVAQSDSDNSQEEDSIELYIQQHDSICRATADSIKSKHLAEYTLMDSIISMSQAIREKTDPDYSGYYWQWMRSCNIQIGIYLREKGLYHGRLYIRDAFAALDSVDHFIDIFSGSDMSQAAMNETAEMKWVIDHLRTEETYQLLYYKMRDRHDRSAVYHDYQNWFWTTEAITNFYYQAIQGGDEGSGSMSSMELAYTALSISKLHRFWLNEELKVLEGKPTLIGNHYRKITGRDFEEEKKRYIQEGTKYDNDNAQRNIDKNRICNASDSLIHVFNRWMTYREHLDKTLKDKVVEKIFSNSTQRIRWNMYQLWQKHFDADKVNR